MKEVARLRSLGARRITLKTGAYPMRELAMAIRWSSDAKIDLLTIDGAPGGTGMSPWRMMTEWGIPSIYLHAMAYELCQRLEKRGLPVPDIAFAGGFRPKTMYSRPWPWAPLLQSGLHGPGIDDPRHGGQKHGTLAQKRRWRPAFHRVQIRHHQG